MRLDHDPQRKLLQVPELRLDERVLLTPARVDLDLTEARIAARDALEAHVRRLSMPQVQVGADATRPGMLADEDDWLETYRSLSKALAKIERLMFAARGLGNSEPFGAKDETDSDSDRAAVTLGDSPFGAGALVVWDPGSPAGPPARS
jgi:hypothetical protein